MNTEMDTKTNMGFLRFDDDAMQSVTFSQRISNWIRIRSERGGEYAIVKLSATLLLLLLLRCY